MSDRINLNDETRVNATSEEAQNWRNQNATESRKPDIVYLPCLIHLFTHRWALDAPPNFITEIFYLTMAMNHYGYQKTLSSFEELAKNLDDLVRHREQLEGDGSWRQVCHDSVITK